MSPVKKSIHNLESGGLYNNSSWFGLEGLSNIKPWIAYPVAGDTGLRVQLLGKCLKVLSHVSVYWSLLLAWNVRSTQTKYHL